MTTAETTANAAAVGLGIRFAARALDAIIAGALVGVLGAVMDFGFVWLALGAVIILAYFALTTAFFGATPAKRLLGLRVVGPDGNRPSLPHSFAREAFVALGAVPFVGPLLALAAWIAIAVTASKSPTGQGLHDRLGGGTRVIRA